MEGPTVVTQSSIRTISGVWIDLLNPHPQQILIEDIAHSLSMQCRWGGHMPYFFSVARHSLNASYLIEDKSLKMAALLHDASEAYILDVPRPLKNVLSGYHGLEYRMMQIISEKFGFAWPLHSAVINIDNLLMEMEYDNIILGKKPGTFVVKSLEETKKEFIDVYNYYKTLK